MSKVIRKEMIFSDKLDRVDKRCEVVAIFDINFIIMSEAILSPLRKIKLFFPPIDSPLLTTYGKSVLPKVQPLKERFSVLSQRKEERG